MQENVTQLVALDYDRTAWTASKPNQTYTHFSDNSKTLQTTACVCVCVCARACVRAGVRACVCESVYARTRIYRPIYPVFYNDTT